MATRLQHEIKLARSLLPLSCSSRLQPRAALEAERAFERVPCKGGQHKSGSVHLRVVVPAPPMDEKHDRLAGCGRRDTTPADAVRHWHCRECCRPSQGHHDPRYRQRCSPPVLPPRASAPHHPHPSTSERPEAPRAGIQHKHAPAHRERCPSWGCFQTSEQRGGAGLSADMAACTAACTGGRRCIWWLTAAAGSPCPRCGRAPAGAARGGPAAPRPRPSWSRS
jgi:hypothetical protein